MHIYIYIYIYIYKLQFNIIYKSTLYWYTTLSLRAASYRILKIDINEAHNCCLKRPLHLQHSRKCEEGSFAHEGGKSALARSVAFKRCEERHARSWNGSRLVGKITVGSNWDVLIEKLTTKAAFESVKSKGKCDFDR